MDEARAQTRTLVRGIAVCLFAFAAGMGLWAYNYVYGHRPAHPMSLPKAAGPPAPILAAPKAATPPAPEIKAATVPGPRYVHRGGSVLRDLPKASGRVLKKEAKGARVILEALEGGGWARVTDGEIRGWMRASVLGINPPEP